MRIVRVIPEGRGRSAETYPASPTDGRAPSAIFIGEVETQGVIDQESRDLRLIEVHFKDGARNRLHVHSTDQILVITEGSGIVATRHEEHAVEAGDVAFIPAGEPHWHGARPGRDLTHWAINGGSTKTSIAE